MTGAAGCSGEPNGQNQDLRLCRGSCIFGNESLESATPRASSSTEIETTRWPASGKSPLTSVAHCQGGAPTPAHSHVPVVSRSPLDGAMASESSSYMQGGGPSTSAMSEVVVDHGAYDDGLTFLQHMIAGSIAGMTEHMAMFPVDTVKTRMQALRCASTTAIRQEAALAPPTVYQALTQILKSEGPVGLYRGIGAMGLGAGPAHAVYFAVYEQAKDVLGGNRKGYQPMAHAAAGAIATVASDAVLTPMDVVKQRLQLARSPYSGVVDCCQKMMEQEGLRAFYTSYRTTLIMNIPFTAVHFATYEAAKKALGEASFGGGEASEDHLLTHLVAGGAAGALASALTNPLDVVKTRLQCQGVCGSRRFRDGSVVGTLSSLVKEEGPRVLWRGMAARVMFHVPAAAIVWSTYEACKGFLKRVSQ